MSAPSQKMFWEGYRGRRIERVVNQAIPDIAEFKETAIYPWLVMAANPHLTAPELERWLSLIALECPLAERPAGWLRDRRRLVEKHRPLNGADLDGKQGRAFKIMAANPGVSLRDLVRLLANNGIERSREWVRWNRGRR